MGDRPYLLVVEDSPTALAVISRNLSEEYDLVAAGDGEAAWELLQSDPKIELVITDINMPKLTGHQLLVKIRKCNDPRIAKLPVFIMTTGSDDADKHLAFLNGANDFLTKPIDSLELQARVNVHYTLASTIRELEASRYKLSEQANTDPLTKIRNRRSFFEEGNKCVSIGRRYGVNQSIIIMDVDYFKKVNDEYGHHAGDQVLIEIAKLITRLTRDVDTVARIGGEEFAVLLPDTNRLGAAVLAERIRKGIENLTISVDGITIKTTVSLGLSSIPAEPLDTFDELLKVADQRLYLAKELGRNRICVNNEGRPDFS
ncbi:MAG: diguanylate cyclase [Gammaproteobacteria bacterium]|nr:MAG: diguanylate cyclase [Gammaproteobacteria bacterium]